LRIPCFIGLLSLFLASSHSCTKDQPGEGDEDLLQREYTIGVYYYPWHHPDFHGAEYLRKNLSPVQQPVLGEYDDRNPTILKSHFDWCRYAGINMLSCSWWGPGLGEDITLKDHILNHPDLDKLKICIHYETAGRTDNFTSLSVVGTDIAYMAQHYFTHPNYYRIDNRPVIMIYLTRVLQHKGMLADFVEELRSSAAAKGINLYIIGDHAFGNAPTYGGDINKLDAITNYDVYGAMSASGYAGTNGTMNYISDQSNWRTLAHNAGIAFIPAICPGFNDKGVRDGHEPLSRQLTESDEFGSLFSELLTGSKPLADSVTGKLIMITSWNEWHEDTQIEPVRKAEATKLDMSNSGEEYTRGLYYLGYDSLYLNILRGEFIQQ
jgi:hypothetical protein